MTLKSRLWRGHIDCADGTVKPIMLRDLTQEEARILDDREAELRAQLEPATREEAEVVIGALLGMFPSAVKNPVDAQRLILGYWVALDDLPLWSLQEAFRRVVRGEGSLGVQKFAPAPPEARQMALQLLSEHHSELKTIKLLKSARSPEPTRSNRDARSALAEKILKGVSEARSENMKK